MNNSTIQWIIYLVVGLIIFYFFYRTRSDVVIIEKGTEGMEDIGTEMEESSAVGLPSNFRLKPNRYLAGDDNGNRSMHQSLPNINCGPGCAWFTPYNSLSNSLSDHHPSTKPCEFHINRESSAWDVPYEPGANNTYDDLIWHYMSPSMVLQNNCMRCNEFGPGTNHVVPEGVAENVIAEHSQTVGIPQREISSLLYDNLELESDPSIAEFPHTLSPPRNNGIVPMEQSCVLAKANSFGKCVYNFH